MSDNPALSPDERFELESQFFRQESTYLRQLRALKHESCTCVSRFSTDGNGPYSKRFKTVKILGKGSFGVVRLVKERRRDDMREQPSRVLAMKVIKKTEMIRSCQQGHLRAERDFLIASENSDW